MTFRIGLSHEVLPRWEPRPLDLVLIDGAHGFPYPILDWWHIAPHVRIGGTVLLDDAYLPAVAAIVDFARSSDAWRVDDAVELPDGAAHEARRRAAAVHGRRRRRAAGRCASPTSRRTGASSPRRGSGVFSTRAGLWAVRRLAGRARPADATRPGG